MKKELTQQLNQYLANVSVLYVKLHNLHWNVVGGQFQAVHEYLETLYDGLADVMDASAEMIRMGGEAPLASMKKYLEVATIREIESKEMDVKAVLSIVLEDMKFLKAQVEKIRTDADQEDVYSVTAMLEKDLENYNKTVWFIESMMK